MSHPPAASPRSTLPAQPFFVSPGQRVSLARERFFADGQRPTGLVSESVIQSWSRCVRAHRSPREAVVFDPVSRSRLHAALARNHELLQAARGELQRLEAALGGTGCRVLLSDADGVLVHVTQAVATSAEPVLQQVSRIGIDLAEQQLGTNAPSVVMKSGAAVTVFGGEHYFDCMQTLHCAAAPIHDGRGHLAGVLDLTVEARPFVFDAAALVGVYATAIENRLLQSGAGEHLVLQFQVCSTMLDTPLQALVGIGSHGRVVWLNGAAQQLLGPRARPADEAEALFGCTLTQLLARTRAAEPQPLRLPSGLTVWLRARLHARDGMQHSVAATAPPARGLAAAPSTPSTSATSATSATSPTSTAAALAASLPPALPELERTTLNQHARELIDKALAAHGGNISRTARLLGVSRGLLYRRLRERPPAA